MAHVDVYGRTNELDRPILDAIAARLEARRGNKHYMSMLHEYLDLVDLSNKTDVLILGCGTGVEVRELIQRPDFAGNVTALDISTELIEHARKSFSSENIGGNVNWLVRDAANTELPDKAFDLVIAHTLISHVPDPNAVLAEMSAKLTEGGTLAIFDGDYATYTFGSEDPEYGKMMDEKLIKGLIANPRIMRSLPRLMKHLGLSLYDSKGWMQTEIGKADFFLGSLDSLPILLPKAGVATVEEVETFVADQRKASDEGTFFAGYNFYAMLAKRQG